MRATRWPAVRRTTRDTRAGASDLLLTALGVHGNCPHARCPPAVFGRCPRSSLNVAATVVADRFSHWGTALAKPELGTKRTCLACGARFYDFGRTADIACPACGAPFDLEQVARARRTRNPVRAVAATKAAEIESDEDEVDEAAEDLDLDVDIEDVDKSDADADEPDVPVSDDDEEEEDPLIEDADELGDDDALGEVIDPDVGEDDDRR